MKRKLGKGNPVMNRWACCCVVLAFVTCAAPEKSEAANHAIHGQRRVVRKKSAPPRGKVPIEQSAAADLKVLKQSVYGSVRDPLLLVARDHATYLALKQEIEELPALDESFFGNSAVVAAFLGTRNTGGYGVMIRREGDKVTVASTSPPADAMTTQAFTHPFAVVAVETKAGGAPTIEAGAPWRDAGTRPYQIDSGTIKISGGIAGRPNEHKLTGRLGVMRHRNIVTVSFDVARAGDAKRRLKTTATGVVRPDGSFDLILVSSGGIVEPPHAPFGVAGKFFDNEDRVTLDLRTGRVPVPDGFGGEGRIEARATAPPPRKSEGEEVF